MTDINSAKLAAMFGLTPPDLNETPIEADDEFDARFSEACDALVAQINEHLPITRDKFTIDVQLSVLSWLHTVAIVRRAVQSLSEEGRTKCPVGEIMLRALEVLKVTTADMVQNELPMAMQSLVSGQGSKP